MGRGRTDPRSTELRRQAIRELHQCFRDGCAWYCDNFQSLTKEQQVEAKKRIVGILQHSQGWGVEINPNKALQQLEKLETATGNRRWVLAVR